MSNLEKKPIGIVHYQPPPALAASQSESKSLVALDRKRNLGP